MIKRLNHIGVVVTNLENEIRNYEKIFGLSTKVVKETMEGKLKVAFIPIGDGEIELLQPVDMTIPFGQFLKAHGQGIHHIAFETDNIENEIKKMKEKGVSFESEKTRIGAHGVPIIFTRPETTGDVTIELCETDPS